MEWLEFLEPVDTLFGAIITSLAGVIVSVVVKSARDTKARLEENSRKMDAMNRASLTVLRRDLRRGYEFYVLGDRPIPESIYREFAEEHAAYAAAGGNGAEPKWWAGIHEKGPATTQEIAIWFQEHPGESLSY